jgi:hypothetical protein
MRKLSEKEKQAIAGDKIRSGDSNRQVAKRHGVNESTVRRLLSSPRHAKPNFTRPPQRKVDPVEYLKQAAARVRGHKKDEDYAMIRIDASQPVAVMKAADLHFGGLDIDYDSLLAHTTFLLNTPNFYIQLFGDDVNLMVMHPDAAARHDGWTPEEQIAWLESFVDECLNKGKIISMASGNHSDEFTERTAGFGIVRAIMKHKVPYFRGLGYIDLKIGKQVYPMAFVHKTRFNSFMNPTHGNKRMEQLHSHLFGVNRRIAREYITAHTHNPAIAVEGCLPAERIYYIKCGTFKTNCVYSQRFFGQGRIGVPTVVYHPDRFEHICFPTPWEAYRYMTGRDWKK